MNGKLKLLIMLAVSIVVMLLCCIKAGAYGETDDVTSYFTVQDGFVYDQYNTQLYTVQDERWQSWVDSLHTEVIRDTLTSAESWFKKGGTGGTIVLNKWGQLICELTNITAKDSYYELEIDETTKAFKLTESTVDWLKNTLCVDLKQAINEGLVPYTYNVYVPYTTSLTKVTDLDLNTCNTEFSYTIHPVLGKIDTIFMTSTDGVYVSNLGGRYGVTVSDAYISNIITLVDKTVFIPREDIQAASATYVKDNANKEIVANACVTARLPIKAPYTNVVLSDVYVDIAKKSLVNNSNTKLLAAVGLSLDNFYTQQGYAYSDKYKELITNGISTLPTGDFLTLSDVINVGTMKALKYDAYPVEYILNSNDTIDIVVNTYGLCIIVPSANINFEKLLISLGTEDVIQNLGVDNVKNGSVFELAKSIYQGLGGDKSTWDNYMVTAGFQEAEGFNFGIIIFIVIVLAAGAGVFFLVKKVKKSVAERKEIENSYTNVLTGGTTKIANTQVEKDEKADKKTEKVPKAKKTKEASKTKVEEKGTEKAKEEVEEVNEVDTDRVEEETDNDGAVEEINEEVNVDKAEVESEEAVEEVVNEEVVEEEAENVNDTVEKAEKVIEEANPTENEEVVVKPKRGRPPKAKTESAEGQPITKKKTTKKSNTEE